jgi:peptidoglycan/xylan/chitin deacetylase (PgdA/CDA1 family)
MSSTVSTSPVSTLRALRRAAAPAAKTLLLRSGAFGAIRRIAPSRKLAILRYHAICGPEGFAYASPGICVSPSAFESHVRYLASRYRVLPLPVAAAALRSKESLPANAVAITFDDGYADNLAAARVLHRYGVSATFYLTAGCLADGQPFWPSEIRYLVAAIPAERVVLTASGAETVIDLASAGERQAAVGRITRLFKSQPIAVRERLRDELRRAGGFPRIPKVMLTWDEVREMHALGMTIGAHTLTHPNLPSAGPADAAAEIRGSRARLETEISDRVTMFSYPNGGAEVYVTPELQRTVADAGFEAATTSRNGFADRGSHPFGLERIEVAERLEDLAFALEVERFAFGPS